MQGEHVKRNAVARVEIPAHNLVSLGVTVNIGDGLERGTFRSVLTLALERVITRVVEVPWHEPAPPGVRSLDKLHAGGTRNRIEGHPDRTHLQAVNWVIGLVVVPGRLFLGAWFFDQEVFVVVLADHLCVTEGTSVLEGMVSVFEARRCSIVALVEVDRRDTGKYGIIAGEVGRDGLINIQDMVEKPAPDEAPSTYAILGRYLLTPDIFPILHETPPGADGELQLTDALRKQAQRGGVLGYVYRGRRFDCGSVEGFMEATKYLYACQHKTT